MSNAPNYRAVAVYRLGVCTHCQFFRYMLANWGICRRHNRYVVEVCRCDNFEWSDFHKGRQGLVNIEGGPR